MDFEKSTHPALHHFIVKLEDFQEGSVPYVPSEIDIFDPGRNNDLIIFHQLVVNLIELQDQLVDQRIPSFASSLFPFSRFACESHRSGSIFLLLISRHVVHLILSMINARFEFARFSFLNVAMILYVASIPVIFTHRE